MRLLCVFLLLTAWCTKTTKAATPLEEDFDRKISFEDTKEEKQEDESEGKTESPSKIRKAKKTVLIGPASFLGCMPNRPDLTVPMTNCAALKNEIINHNTEIFEKPNAYNFKVEDLRALLGADLKAVAEEKQLSSSDAALQTIRKAREINFTGDVKSSEEILKSVVDKAIKAMEAIFGNEAKGITLTNRIKDVLGSASQEDLYKHLTYLSKVIQAFGDSKEHSTLIKEESDVKQLLNLPSFSEHFLSKFEDPSADYVYKTGKVSGEDWFCFISGHFGDPAPPSSDDTNAIKSDLVFEEFLYWLYNYGITDFQLAEDADQKLLFLLKKIKTTDLYFFELTSTRARSELLSDGFLRHEHLQSDPEALLQHNLVRAELVHSVLYAAGLFDGKRALPESRQVPLIVYLNAMPLDLLRSVAHFMQTSEVQAATEYIKKQKRGGLAADITAPTINSPTAGLDDALPTTTSSSSTATSIVTSGEEEEGSETKEKVKKPKKILTPEQKREKNKKKKSKKDKKNSSSSTSTPSPSTTSGSDEKSPSSSTTPPSPVSSDAGSVGGSGDTVIQGATKLIPTEDKQKSTATDTHEQLIKAAQEKERKRKENEEAKRKQDIVEARKQQRLAEKKLKEAEANAKAKEELEKQKKKLARKNNKGGGGKGKAKSGRKSSKYIHFPDRNVKNREVVDGTAVLGPIIAQPPPPGPPKPLSKSQQRKLEKLNKDKIRKPAPEPPSENSIDIARKLANIERERNALNLKIKAAQAKKSARKDKKQDASFASSTDTSTTHLGVRSKGKGKVGGEGGSSVSSSIISLDPVLTEEKKLAISKKLAQVRRQDDEWYRMVQELFASESSNESPKREAHYDKKNEEKEEKEGKSTDSKPPSPPLLKEAKKPEILKDDDKPLFAPAVAAQDDPSLAGLSENEKSFLSSLQRDLDSILNLDF